MCAISNIAKLIKALKIPPLRVRHRIAEHVQKHAPQKLVQLFDLRLTQVDQFLGLVEDGGDFALGVDGWEGDYRFLKELIMPIVSCVWKFHR